MKKTVTRTSFPFTDHLRYGYQLMMALEEAKGTVAKPVGWLFSKKVDVSTLLRVVERHAEARASFWNTVYSTYPELKDKRLSTNGNSIVVVA